MAVDTLDQNLSDRDFHDPTTRSCVMKRVWHVRRNCE
jgi:hypothetical protein